MSYLFSAFLPAPQIPSAEDAKEYLIEGALFNERPKITITETPERGFMEMSLLYDPTKKPMILRRIFGEDEEAARSDAAAEASAPECESIEKAIQTAPVVLEWEVERSEMDKDAWVALHLWQ